MPSSVAGRQTHPSPIHLFSSSLLFADESIAYAIAKERPRSTSLSLSAQYQPKQMKMAASCCFSSPIPFTATFVPSTPFQRSLSRAVLCMDLPLSPTPVSAQPQLPITRLLAGGARIQPLEFSRVKAAAGQTAEVVGSPNSVPVRVAYELLQAGHRYLDVRTEEEFSRGHVEAAVNIPYMFKFGNGLTKNPNFLEEVASRYRSHDEILVGCQSGKRSLMAATDLYSAGFTGITDIAGGFSAWTQTGLPMEK